MHREPQHCGACSCQAATLSLLQVSRGSLVLDPYVGTGSILIAAAARGAHTMGCDIDVRVLKQGRRCPKTGKQVDIYSNYEQYGLQYPVGLVRMDVHTHPFREGLGEVFDVILGDPPYGVRAGGRKLVAKCHPIRFPGSHIPSTEPYSLTECLADLLELAAASLLTGGRLVFFMPASPETYREDQLPLHPMLAMVSNVEQPLQSRYSRRLVTMVKVKPYDPVLAAHLRSRARTL
ncbi:S-adenosyl-L-methionine-dependent methyltransferase [Scenedesmus sp. NREL 46B-D3]|nr:S-adenosyl-L-methionine-dependent methyltransferase [Scenedesmus sp. NREL 46B-D3]